MEDFALATATTLARIYLQTAALSVLLAGTGYALYRRAFPASEGDPLALSVARGFFVGLCAFLPVFVLLSRLIGARTGLFVILAAMAVACGLEAWRLRSRILLAPACVLVLGLAALVALYSVTTLAMWLWWAIPPLSEPNMMTHFGSIHAGRYANYSILIVDHDRVPFFAQNAGQSILASVHLLLGSGSPLAALMAWIPFTLAFLTLLLHGIFRSGGHALFACAAAAMMVIFCNITVSAQHVLLFDNGSPIAFIGYNDLIASIGTFLLACLGLRSVLDDDTRPPWRSLAYLALLVAPWCWYAPQNLILFAATAIFAVALKGWRQRNVQVVRRMALPVATFAVATLFGALQLGTFLPLALREPIGYWTQETGSTINASAYVTYLRNHWSGKRWNNEVDYEVRGRMLVKKETPPGPDAFRNRTWEFEQSLWSSLRIYGFAFLGLAALGFALRRLPEGPQRDANRAWLWLSAASFGAGYLFVFGFELQGMKWWLTRFLPAGIAMALSCLAIAALIGFARLARGARIAAWAALLVATTFGTVAEFADAAMKNFANPGNPFGHRLNLLVRTTGPFVFEGLTHRPEVAKAPSFYLFVVGGADKTRGLALESMAMTLAPGRHRVGFRINTLTPPGGGEPVVALDAVTAPGTRVIAQRAFAPAQLEKRPDGAWAWLDFELDSRQSVQLRLLSVSDAVFEVRDMRLRRQ